MLEGEPWPASADELVEVQADLGEFAVSTIGTEPRVLPSRPLIGGCFVAFARREGSRREGSTGTDGAPGVEAAPAELAWAAAVAWRPPVARPREHEPLRSPDKVLRGTGSNGAPRKASDVDRQAVVVAPVSAPYKPGLLALREGPILTAAVRALQEQSRDESLDVLLVNATGLDHPRRAGFAVHLGAVTGLTTVGVTHRPLLATGEFPELTRGERSVVTSEGLVVGYWLCTRSGARPVLAHAGWRTDPETAAAVVLRASTEAARTPVPIEEARRVAREARALEPV